MHFTPEQQAADESTSPGQLWQLANSREDLRQVIARNPNASPELLRKLAGEPDFAIRQGVATNPNTPTDVLLKLGTEFPAQLIDNPIFTLLLLEKPNFVKTIPPYMLQSLSKQSFCPIPIRVEYILRSGDQNILNELLMDSELSRDVLNRFVSQRTYPAIAETAKLHINWAGEMTEGWDEFAMQQTVQSIFSSVPTPYDYFDIFAKLDYIPDVLITHAANSADSIPRSFFAARYANSNTISVFELLTNDEESLKRIAGNPNTPAPILKKLITSQDIGVRWEARATLTRYHFVESLKISRSSWSTAWIWIPISIFDWASMTVSIPLFLIISFLASSHPLLKWLHISIRCVIVLALLAFILFHIILLIQITSILLIFHFNLFLLSLFALSALIYGVGIFSAAVILPAIESLPTLHLFRLIGDPFISVKYWKAAKMAADPRTSINTLEQISRIPNPSVRWRLLRNPNLPDNILERLSEDKEILAMMEYSYVPERFFKYLLLTKGYACKYEIEKYLKRRHPEIKKWVLEGYARANALIVRLIVLFHPDIPAHMLIEKAKSWTWLERYAVTQNPNIPPAILQQLAKDANRVVRAAAKARLID